MSRFFVAACAGLVLLGGCGSGAPADSASGSPALTREQFIEVFVALREAAREAEDQSTFEERKREVLEKYDVDAETLLAFARSAGGDVQAMVQLWDTINARLTPRDSTEQQASGPATDSTAAPPPDSSALPPSDSALPPSDSVATRQDSLESPQPDSTIEQGSRSAQDGRSRG